MTTDLLDWTGKPLPQGMATVVGKAGFGAGVLAYEFGTPLSDYRRSPRKLMREAQMAYRTHPWIRVAERAVTRRVVGLPWHLEDGEDEAIDDAAILDLLEQPQLRIPPKDRQTAVTTRRGLWSVTSRHMGLCNLAHWYLDMVDGNGLPGAILYINPARLLSVSDPAGNLKGWLLDPLDDEGRGGTPLEPSEVLTFYLDPPDEGHYGSGLYEAAIGKARITTYADRHVSQTYGNGGRIPGIVAPKAGLIDNDDQYDRLVNEFRNVNESPDAAKRTTILRGPVDYIRTGGDTQELGTVELSKMTREDLLSVWGVPASQAPIATVGGLNSGETKGYDEAMFMQGAVHDRVVVFRETIQFGLLDRWKPKIIELHIEEPEFDDETPQYDRASKSSQVAMTRNERRAIIGLDPLPEFGLDGSALGIAIDLPVMLSVVGEGPATETRPPVVVVSEVPQLTAGKATIPALVIRDRLHGKFEPPIRKAMAAFLSEQRADIATRLRAKADHLSKRHDDRSAWWDEKRWDEKLLAVLRPHLAGLAASTFQTVGEGLKPGKAAPFEDRVADAVLRKVGLRIIGINGTTRDAVAASIAAGFDRGLSVAEIADGMESLPAFDAARAETVARTESMFTYNDAALESYREFDVERVEALDGDGDEECAARNGQVYTIEEAAGIEDHPNGTLAWAPYFGKATLSPVALVESPGSWGLPPVVAPVAPAFDIAEIVAALKAEPIHVTAEPNGLRTVIDYDDAGDFAGYHEVSVAVVRDAYGDLVLEETHA